MNVDLNKYSEFVLGVTSETSKDTEKLIQRIKELNQHVNVSLILTATTGLAGESGELSEIWKKTVFHGKLLTDESLAHCKKELGDIIFYWINACNALGFDPNEVISENVDKLSARYPGGVFSVVRSENRAAGDV